MDIYQHLIAGALGGMLVANWNSFKDSPWEGFKAIKYVRSPLFGMVASLLIYTLISYYGSPDFFEFGTLVFCIITIERIFGEAYKGFFRKNYHIEFKTGFKFYNLARFVKSYSARVLFGVLFVILVTYMFLHLNKLFFDLLAGRVGVVTYGMVVGLLGGIVCALSGALKDVPWEGFLIKKFIRSPFAGLVGGGIVAFLSKDTFYLFLAAPGIERAFVETYKTFWKEGVRGIFEDKKPKYEKWFAKRIIFKIGFFAILSIIFVSLIVQ